MLDAIAALLEIVIEATLELVGAVADVVAEFASIPRSAAAGGLAVALLALVVLAGSSCVQSLEEQRNEVVVEAIRQEVGERFDDVSRDEVSRFLKSIGGALKEHVVESSSFDQTEDDPSP